MHGFELESNLRGRATENLSVFFFDPVKKYIGILVLDIFG